MFLDDDIRQEMALFNLENPESRKPKRYIITDILRKQYPHKYNRTKNKYTLLSIDDCLEDTEKNLQYCNNPGNLIDAKQMISYLDRRDRDILVKYFWLNMNQREIGIIYGYTSARINQLIAQSLRKIRKCLRIN